MLLKCTCVIIYILCLQNMRNWRMWQSVCAFECAARDELIQLITLYYLLGQKFFYKLHVSFALHIVLSTDEDADIFFLFFWMLLNASSYHLLKVWQKAAAAAEDIWGWIIWISELIAKWFSAEVSHVNRLDIFLCNFL